MHDKRPIQPVPEEEISAGALGCIRDAILDGSLLPHGHKIRGMLRVTLRFKEEWEAAYNAREKYMRLLEDPGTKYEDLWTALQDWKEKLNKANEVVNLHLCTTISQTQT